MKRNRPLLLLIGLLVVLVAVAFYEVKAPGGANGAASGGDARAAVRPGQARVSTSVPDVKLAALAAARKEPAPKPSERNLFRFQMKAAPAAPVPVRPSVATATGPGAGGPAMAAPPPPIPLKFIGIVEAPSKKLAVLMLPDTKDVFYGKEGDIIDGRYRILRIGVESIEMAYLDGRGRQAIRMTGS
jgi:hypothetical protein